jgi:hypothetical protein
MIRRFFTSLEVTSPAEKVARRETRRLRRSRPALETLEGRTLLSFFGSEHRVSLNPENSVNSNSDNASSSNGNSVAVWVNAASANDHDIWAQRFDNLGNATGAPIEVDFTTHDSYDPHVSMDNQGRFVVTWENVNPDGTWSVLMRYFSASGAPLTGITQVTPSGSVDVEPDVATSDGSFVISWTHYVSATNDDIYAERFVVSGGVPSGQGIFGVNTDANLESDPSVAMSPDGRFDIAYQRQFSGIDWDIYANQYGSTGIPLHHVGINDDANPEYSPSISMDNADNAVVAYQRFTSGYYSIYANRLSSSGIVGGLITVQAVGGISETNPSVALAPTGSQFVVSYNIGDLIGVTEMGSDDLPLAAPDQTLGASPAISIDGFNRFVVTYQRYDPSTGHNDIFSRRDYLGGEDQVSPDLLAGDNFESDSASSSNGSSVAVWVDAYSASDHDIWAQRFDTTGHAIGDAIPVDLTTADSYDPRVSMDGEGRFVVAWEDFHPDGSYSVLVRYFSASGSALTGITSVTPSGSTNLDPDVAASDGSFVIAWTHQASATNDDIDAERFAITNNVPHGQGIFGVNTDANFEAGPSVAMSPSGSFDIAYQRQFNGSDWDIFASQYGNTGHILRSNIPINFDSNFESSPSVSMDNAGNAVVAYQEYVGGDYGVYANRLSAGGAVGGRITVQAVGGGVNETEPSVALAPTGGQFVVAYETQNLVDVTEIGSDDSPLATLDPFTGGDPAISIDGLDRYVITYTRLNSTTGHDDIFSRRSFLS